MTTHYPPSVRPLWASIGTGLRASPSVLRHPSFWGAVVATAALTVLVALMAVRDRIAAGVGGETA